MLNWNKNNNVCALNIVYKSYKFMKNKKTPTFSQFYMDITY